MTKTRLNNNYRHVLTRHVYKFLDELQLNPNEHREVRAAQRRRDTVSAKLTAAAIAAVKAWVPDKDMDTLRRYSLTKKISRATFVPDGDSSLAFAVELFDAAPFDRDIDAMQADELAQRDRDREKAFEAAQIEVPVSPRDVGVHADRRLIPCPKIMHTLNKDFELAVREEGEAKKRLREKHHKLMTSLQTLIDGSRYYEDVVAVWPQAAEVQDRIIGQRKAISVLSTEALDDIAKASEIYQQMTGKTAPALPGSQKALPAPAASTDAAVIVN